MRSLSLRCAMLKMLTRGLPSGVWSRRFTSSASPVSQVLKPGDALPSVRQIAAEYQLNPITVSRAYQELADEDLVEKRRGLGMYMTDGARDKLLASERERFLKEEWPAMVERINRLGLDVEKLLRNANAGGAA